MRTRSCVSSPYGTLCSGALRETRMCNNTASCPGEPGITGSGALTGCLWPAPDSLLLTVLFLLTARMRWVNSFSECHLSDAQFYTVDKHDMDFTLWLFIYFESFFVQMLVKKTGVLSLQCRIHPPPLFGTAKKCSFNPTSFNHAAVCFYFSSFFSFHKSVKKTEENNDSVRKVGSILTTRTHARPKHI